MQAEKGVAVAMQANGTSTATTEGEKGERKEWERKRWLGAEEVRGSDEIQ